MRIVVVWYGMLFIYGWKKVRLVMRDCSTSTHYITLHITLYITSTHELNLTLNLQSWDE